MNAWKLNILALAVAAGSAAHAVEPQGIALGSGVTLLPALDLRMIYDDNIYLQPSDTAVESSIMRVRPALGVNVDLGATQLQAGVALEHARYGKDSDDDFTNKHANVDVSSELDARNTISAGYQFNTRHDSRGSGTVEGANALAIPGPDRYNEQVLDLDYRFGASGALLNLRAFGQYYDREYQNNEAQGTANRNHEKTQMGFGVDVRVSPATKALVELRSTDINYASGSNIAADGTELKMLLGASWDITGKTTGSVKLGMAEREFDGAGKSIDDRFTWEASVIYTPISHSVLSFSTAQSGNETNGAGTYIASEFSAVNWKHTFSPFFALMADVSAGKDTYVDDTNGRKDDTLSYGISGVFSPVKSLDIKLSATQSERDSNITGLDYDKQVIELAFSLAL